MTAAAGLAAVIVVAAMVADRPHPRPQPAVRDGPGVDPNALEIDDLQAGRGMRLRTDPPPLPPAVELPLQLRVEPSPPSPSDPQVLAAREPIAEPPPAPVGPAEPLQIATGALASGAASGLDGPVDEYLRPKQIVAPRVPDRYLRKHHIDSAVVVQMWVGNDGRVEAVRLVRGIPNCDLCNESAIEAARQVVYDAPARPVWAAPVTMKFSYR